MSSRSPRPSRSGFASALALLAAGCGHAAAGGRDRVLPPDLRPIPAGRSPAYRLPATPGHAPVGRLRCTRRHGPTYAAHLELYADGLVLPVPAGIGIAPPRRRDGAYVNGGRCAYPLRTYEPTGLVVIDHALHPAPTLAELFAVWGQPLSAHRLAGFRGRVEVFVGGRPGVAGPNGVRLSRHAELVVEVGAPTVPPHRRYEFPPSF